MSYPASRTAQAISLRSSSCASGEKSARAIPPIRTAEKSATSLSPCSPSTSASTVLGATSSRAASDARRRLESSNVPVPITRLAGRPAKSNATMVMRSTGLDAMSNTPWKPAVESRTIQSRTITALRAAPIDAFPFHVSQHLPSRRRCAPRRHRRILRPIFLRAVPVRSHR